MSVLQGIKAAAAAAHVPFELLRAVCVVESNLDPQALNRDDGLSASYGLCQIKLTTAKGVGYRGNALGLFNSHTNARYAAKYLGYQLRRYDHNWVKAISAYNMGHASKRNSDYVGKVFSKLIQEESSNESRCKNKEHSCRLRKHPRPQPKGPRH